MTTNSKATIVITIDKDVQRLSSDRESAAVQKKLLDMLPGDSFFLPEPSCLVVKHLHAVADFLGLPIVSAFTLSDEIYVQAGVRFWLLTEPSSEYRSSEDDRSKVDHDRYFYQPDGDRYWMLPAGERMGVDSDSQLSREISEAEYNKGRQDQIHPAPVLHYSGPLARRYWKLQVNGGAVHPWTSLEPLSRQGLKPELLSFVEEIAADEYEKRSKGTRRVRFFRSPAGLYQAHVQNYDPPRDLSEHVELCWEEYSAAITVVMNGVKIGPTGDIWLRSSVTGDCKVFNLLSKTALEIDQLSVDHDLITQDQYKAWDDEFGI